MHLAYTEEMVQLFHMRSREKNQRLKFNSMMKQPGCGRNFWWGKETRMGMKIWIRAKRSGGKKREKFSEGGSIHIMSACSLCKVNLHPHFKYQRNGLCAYYLFSCWIWPSKLVYRRKMFFSMEGIGGWFSRRSFPYTECHISPFKVYTLREWACQREFQKIENNLWCFYDAVLPWLYFLIS